MVSTLGRVGVSPYTDEDEANTNLLTPSSLAAINILRVPLIFVSFVATGSEIERGTEGIAP